MAFLSCGGRLLLLGGNIMIAKPIIGVLPLWDKGRNSLWMLPVYMHGKKFVWAVQWHPELSYKTDDTSLEIFKRFINACR